MYKKREMLKKVVQTTSKHKYLHERGWGGVAILALEPFGKSGEISGVGGYREVFADWVTKRSRLSLTERKDCRTGEYIPRGDSPAKKKKKKKKKGGDDFFIRQREK